LLREGDAGSGLEVAKEREYVGFEGKDNMGKKRTDEKRSFMHEGGRTTRGKCGGVISPIEMRLGGEGGLRT